jgi:hypothetical protein
MPRRIIYRPEFDADCASLGGIPAVQNVIAPLVQSLEDGDPNAFGLLDTNRGIRWARLKAIGNMPSLAVTFRVDQDDDVEMISVGPI